MAITKNAMQIADKWFSRYIRLKYSNNGACQCVTCGKWKEVKYIQNGHYISRGVKALRYSEYNSHPQCKQCNLYREGRKDVYARFIVQKYGQKIKDDLDSQQSAIKLDYSVIADYYKKKTNELLKEKGEKKWW